MRGLGLAYVGAGNMYKLWGQSSCSVHPYNIIKQYMHTVAYMALTARTGYITRPQYRYTW